MAEYCEKCFRDKVLIPSDSDIEIIVSSEAEFCEGCATHSPIVLSVNSKTEN